MPNVDSKQPKQFTLDKPFCYISATDLMPAGHGKHKRQPHTFVHERRARFPLVTLYDEQHKKVFLSDVLGSACWLPLFVALGISSLLKKVWCHNLVVECIDCPWTKSKLFVPVRACLNVCWAQMCYLWLLGLLETSVFFLILIYCLQGINNSVPQLL